MIEQAYTLGETLGIAVWCEDEAGPYGTVPYAGPSWQRAGQPAEYPHEYFREGTAKMITLFCNGPWCSLSVTTIQALLEIGYPTEKIKWYRGGMQEWLAAGMTSTRK